MDAIQELENRGRRRNVPSPALAVYQKSGLELTLRCSPKPDNAGRGPFRRYLPAAASSAPFAPTEASIFLAISAVAGK